ncbi:hypothetical protein [Methanimicrococcus hacksteinii]|uniref:hypothetical protein n=1 Tax=Methanimicrococcus hacksteinii TaxID=3028293 RepID=UPI00298EF53F|nr:hypothetical protein [Methanimicrococcus sp. At1]
MLSSPPDLCLRLPLHLFSAAVRFANVVLLPYCFRLPLPATANSCRGSTRRRARRA